MPKVMKLGHGYWAVFFVGDRNEPVHVHVIRGSDYKRSSKFWILRNGYVDIQTNGLRLNQKEIGYIAEHLANNSEHIMKLWIQMFGHIEFYE